MDETSPQRGRVVIWRVSDGRAGHDTQSTGLQQAMAAIKDCDSHELGVQPASLNLPNLLLGRFPPGDSLPDPDFIIGAGHGTHLSLLAARRARGGKTVVLMKPTLPLALFDFCLIPSHDLPPRRNNVLVTQGALNCVIPSRDHLSNTGMILIGGESRHYGWDNEDLLRQIRGITAGLGGVKWEIADSPRTPDSTRLALRGQQSAGLVFVPFKDSPRGWLTERLRTVHTVWITEDSISMIYEALTAGAAVGILSVPVKRNSRITRAIDTMVKKGLVIRYTDWQGGDALRPVDPPLNEAARCARLLFEKTGLI